MSVLNIAVVTGGGGFIGSHMVDLLLAKGYEVRVIDNFSSGQERNLAHLVDNRMLTVYNEDILDLMVGHSAFHGCRYVFHFAGIGDIVPSIERPIKYMEANVQGTIKVLEAARAEKVQKFVYAASSSCYGLAQVPTSEKHQISPQYPYALAKYQGEQAAFHWCEVYGLPVNSVCIFNAYGTRARTTGAYGAVFGIFLRQKLAGKPYTVVGDGTQSRDFIYVSDVVNGFFAAAKSDLIGERFNLGTGEPQTVNRLVELLGGEVIHIPKRPGEPDCTFADIRKASSALQWKPVVKFDQGVEKMLGEISQWEDAPLWDAESIDQVTQSWFEHLGKKNS